MFAGSIDKEWMVLSEYLLMSEFVAIIYIEKRLMLWVIWKESALYSQRRRDDGSVESQLAR